MDPILTKESYENKGIIETNYKKNYKNPPGTWSLQHQSPFLRPPSPSG